MEIQLWSSEMKLKLSWNSVIAYNKLLVHVSNEEEEIWWLDN